MATKVKVVLQRAEAKDYRNIAEMVSAGVNLPDGLAVARELFRPIFQPTESMNALVYFGDGDLKSLSEADQTTLIKAVGSVGHLRAVEIVSQTLGKV